MEAVRAGLANPYALSCDLAPLGECKGEGGDGCRAEAVGLTDFGWKA
jgi:hypothetical protein